MSAVNTALSVAPTPSQPAATTVNGASVHAAPSRSKDVGSGAIGGNRAINLKLQVKSGLAQMLKVHF